MITFKARDFYYTNGKDRVEGECLSTDTKPTTYANGSVLIEMDTGDRFMFDEANEEWLNITNPGGGGGDAEVWLTGSEYEDVGGRRMFTLINVDATDHITELYNNHNNYDVSMNGEQLPYFYQASPEQIVLMNNENMEQATVVITLTSDSNGTAIYLDASTAPTSVEVSVKAK